MSKPATSFNLFFIIMSDLSRHLFLLVLYISLVGSAVAVVISSHENRQLVMKQEQLVNEKDALDVEWRHLIIEQSSLTEHNRIERVMRDQLSMKRPSRDDEVLLRMK